MDLFSRLTENERVQVLSSTTSTNPGEYADDYMLGFMSNKVQDVILAVMDQLVDFADLQRMHDDMISKRPINADELSRTMVIGHEAAFLAVELHNSVDFPYRLDGVVNRVINPRKTGFQLSALQELAHPNVRWDCSGHDKIIKCGPIGAADMTDKMFNSLAEVSCPTVPSRAKMKSIGCHGDYDVTNVLLLSEDYTSATYTCDVVYDSRTISGLCYTNTKDRVVSCSAIYPKINGIPYVVIQVDGRHFGVSVMSSGLHVVPLPGNMGWRVERVDNDYYVRHAMYDFGIQVDSVRPPYHMTTVPNDGYIVVIGLCEYRLKYVPTIDLQLSSDSEPVHSVRADPSRLSGIYEVTLDGCVLRSRQDKSIPNSTDRITRIRASLTATRVGSFCPRSKRDCYTRPLAISKFNRSRGLCGVPEMFALMRNYDVSRFDERGFMTWFVEHGYTLLHDRIRSWIN